MKPGLYTELSLGTARVRGLIDRIPKVDLDVAIRMAGLEIADPAPQWRDAVWRLVPADEEVANPLRMDILENADCVAGVLDFASSFLESTANSLPTLGYRVTCWWSGR